ncbi:unnamed protein product [Peniophora sp. CBMAI 1063]|nr:unnamed protein product [Peniophora sp. CBMAI 1063]
MLPIHLILYLALPFTVIAAVTSDPLLALDKTFDYIIIGGGTAGLALAGRLSEPPHINTEDPSVTVLVIEAAPDNRTSPIEEVVDFPVGIGSALDWAYATVDGKVIHGGRTLGGSSAINGGSWTRGMRAQYDAFASLLEPEDKDKGWDWEGLFRYMKKAERFSPPNATQRALGANSVAAYHGYDGPVHVAFPTDIFVGPANPFLVDTVCDLTGVKLIADISGGEANGVVWDPISLNKFANDSRSSSAAAYLTPVEHARTNWLTLVEHTATKILFSPPSPGQPLKATSVQFGRTPPANASTSTPIDETVIFTAHARREVLLAAGAIRTPAWLQLSGIGDRTMLESLGIEVKVELGGVGRNLQEQTNAVMGVFGGGGFEGAFGGRGPDTVVAMLSLYELFGQNASAKVREIESNLEAWAESQAGNTGADARALREVFGVVAGTIVDDHAPILELYYDLSLAPTTIQVPHWNLLPFSRGTISITSTNPFAPPSISPNWFSVPFDMSVQLAGARLVRSVFETPPMRDITNGTEALPSFDVVPRGASDAVWAEWILGAFEGNSHPLGTAAMMRRALGGVVGADLKVYGTANVRVVDASILPIQLSAHLSSTVYGVAEKAADIVKGAWRS